MHTTRSSPLTRWLIALAALLVSGCQTTVPGEPVSLEPDDPRPVLSLQVGDADEASLLVQELGLEVLRVDGATVYFFEPEAPIDRLRELGYQPTARNPYEVHRRVVRIDRRVPEKELRGSGVRLINREADYLVVEASLAQLRALKRAGSHFAAVGGHEPRPRQVRITVESIEDVAAIGAMNVDIYSSQRVRKPPEGLKAVRPGDIVIFAGAFDVQIDALEAAGYDVEVLP